MKDSYHLVFVGPGYVPEVAQLPRWQELIDRMRVSFGITVL